MFVGVGGDLTPDSGAASGYDVSNGSVGVSGSVGAVKLALISQGGTSYTGLQIDGLSGDFHGLDPVTVHVAGASALANTVSGRDDEAELGRARQRDPAVLVRHGSDARRVAAPLRRRRAVARRRCRRDRTSFSLDHTTASGSDNASSAPITLTGADVWAFHLGASQVFVGVGGGLSLDSGAASGYDVTNGSVGVSGSVTEVKLAQITQGGATYTGVEVDGLSGDLVGLVGLTVHVKGVTALANSVSGSATPLNWAGLDSGILPFSFDRGSRAPSRCISPARPPSRSAPSSPPPRTRSRSTTRPRAARTTRRRRRSR